MKLDTSSLEQALQSLQKAIERSKNEPQDEVVRDAVIQRFEYTYELCWRMLKRQIEKESATPADVDQLAFKDLIRDAAERGILSNVEVWFDYRTQRNITAHTYDREKAQSVYETALKFAGDAEGLLAELQKRNS